jgi:Ion channel
MVTTMVGRFELLLGVLLWCAVLWDGFATVILPRTVDPKRRLSSRVTRWSWRLWASMGRSIHQPGLRLTFLAVFGPLAAIFLLALGGGLIIVAFALIFHGLGLRFQTPSGPGEFSTMLYMSGSTFLTLGLADLSSADPIGRIFVVLEAASGYTFLALMISYMPVLDQAYGAREIGGLLIHSRAGRPPGALGLLRRYAGADQSEILRGNLREAEHWMAETIQSHVSHPVLALYRGQSQGRSWLISLAAVLDSCALLIAAGEGFPAAQARLTYRMGLRLLKDLTKALGIAVDPSRPLRLTEADLPALVEAVNASRFTWKLEPAAARELVRLVRRYDEHLVTLAAWLMIPLPPWIPAAQDEDTATALGPDDLDD